MENLLKVLSAVGGAAEGKLKSKIGLIGIARKLFIFGIIAIDHMLETALGDQHVIRSATIFFYMANELLSILENAGRIGLPVPDVSKWQGEINRNQVESDGVKYAFIKATEGTSLVDRKLKENAQGANRAGIKVGYYHFAHPDLSVQSQAEHFVQNCQRATV
ncbi:GH25 family lysozyme [Brevibacillus laterosporus]|uniref:GH25 family lysozyme n=1 Tax=Brevibacillus laterosporus TaxID=1465 RepID=UPI000367D556|nr:GH25 family lysozyme [Brevibacillus laterosporus]ATO50289.1 hypothetical protein BrL25_15060 [Brevibacillus laterosporus DSM 25]PPA82821.1 hypothetical protein C4A75_17135 [Brevibacillus laterosporus]TPH14274.1 hypothetical protein EGH09_13690 [Brevibacillus laterosporus]